MPLKVRTKLHFFCCIIYQWKHAKMLRRVTQKKCCASLSSCLSASKIGDAAVSIGRVKNFRIQTNQWTSWSHTHHRVKLSHAWRVEEDDVGVTHMTPSQVAIELAFWKRRPLLFENILGTRERLNLTKERNKLLNRTRIFVYQERHIN